MIYILEGPDGVGKTTLAKKLTEKHNGLYIHCSYVTNVYQLHRSVLKQCFSKENKDKDIFIDRLYISEWVYGSIFRGGESYDTEKLRREFIHRIIRVNVPFHNYMKHHHNNSEREMFKTNIPEIYNKYEEYFKYHRPDYYYDYTMSTELDL